MKWGSLIGIIVIVALMILFEWPKINRSKEKIAFIILTAIGFVLAIVLLFYPDMPGPTQMLISIFKPFGKLLKK
ncbi:MAG: hypothetical protein K0S39_4036 [Paenibacillus sp.]|jgi:multisubunit Na+/H+ antiporter MnhB subunit|nr:hypothetical protein [Paenibacillus sp.]